MDYSDLPPTDKYDEAALAHFELADQINGGQAARYPADGSYTAITDADGVMTLYRVVGKIRPHLFAIATNQQ